MKINSAQDERILEEKEEVEKKKQKKLRAHYESKTNVYMNAECRIRRHI